MCIVHAVTAPYGQCNWNNSLTTSVHRPGGTQAASDDDFSEQDEGILADVPDPPVTTRSQGRLAAAAKPQPKAQPKPKPRAEPKPKPQLKAHALFAPRNASNTRKGAGRNPSPTTGPPPICVGCFQPLQPGMAICGHFCKIWTYQTSASQTSSGSAAFVRLSIHLGCTQMVVYVCVCEAQHISTSLDTAWTINYSNSWTVHFLLAMIPCFSLCFLFKLEKAQKWQFSSTEGVRVRPRALDLQIPYFFAAFFLKGNQPFEGL